MGFFNFLKGKEAEEDNFDEGLSDNIEKYQNERDDMLDEDTVWERDNDINEEIKSEKGITLEICSESTVNKLATGNEVSEECDSNAGIEENNDTEEPKNTIFARLFAGLDKTRKNILGGVDSVLGAFTKIDEELFEDLEEALIIADIGVETTMDIMDSLRRRVKKENIVEPSKIKKVIVEEITDILTEDSDQNKGLLEPTVLLVIGVNGVGKTTTIGKLSNKFKKEGKKVLLAAADTFRAAAIEQLEVWGERSGIDVIKHNENSDPAAVIFDAVGVAKNRKVDMLICDTAGRLHNKKNLMEELKKISKIIDREYPTANKEVYLVLDATTGQNAMQQAKLFKGVADITGIILTKLDGTAKGGIVIAIKSELKIPVKYIGVGEGLDDLQKFDANEFAKALFGDE